jgi:hypothetical protein
VINRSQGIVLAFFGFIWIGLVIILVAAPSVYDRTLKLASGNRGIGEVGFLAAISALIALLSLGVVRHWRWTFWLILVAFLAGVLRVPASILEISGTISTRDPTWYVLFQGVLGVIQFIIGLALLAGYRQAGVWGDF